MRTPAIPAPGWRWTPTTTAILADPTRPQVAPPRDRYVYYPDAAEVPESAAVNIRNRSYTITAEVDVSDTSASGVLFSHGARFGGHSLYVKEGLLKYVYNFVGEKEQMIESSKPIPTGKVLLGAAFVRENEEMPTRGMLTLYINDEKVGEGKIMTQPGNFSLVGEGLNIGIDPGVPVTNDYAGTNPYQFTGGKIFRVLDVVEGEPYVNLEREAQMAFLRD